MPYTPTTWINDSPPALNATNLNKLTNELEAQAAARSISHSLPNWVNAAPPALTDASPLNEMERVMQLVASSLGLSYTPTVWSSGWTPARNAARFNKLEQQAQANRAAMEGTPAPIYPASYFNGPLGSRNFVPPKRGAFLITWGIGTAGQDGWPQAQQNIIAREAAMGRKYDGLMTTYFEHEGDWALDKMRWIHNRGCLPIMAGFHFAPLNVTEIANGAADSTIDRYADHMRNLGFDVMIRMFHEQDLPHLSYTCKNREADFVRAWQRVVNRFKARGATNCGFWWCPMEGYDRASADASYPGDAYVDWVGTDPYNYSYVGEDGYSSPMHPGWATFAEIANYPRGSEYPYPDPGAANIVNRHDQYGPRKPFVIGETATTYDPSFPSYKEAWYRDIPATARQMEYLCGISFFDQDVSIFEGPKTNWLIAHPTSRPEMLAAFVSLARDSWFNTRT